MRIKKLAAAVLLFSCSLFSGISAFAAENQLSSIADSAQEIHTTRLSGGTRYETAKVISEYYSSGKVQNVILSTGNKFADALSASVLAHEKEAPILLVDSSVEKSQDAFNYIVKHLDSTGTVYITGGSGVIGSGFERKLNELGFKNLVRIAGANRYETSYQIAQLLKDQGSSTVVVSSGDQYPDALSISSFAAHKGWPILLSPQRALLQEMKDLLLEKKPAKVYITGGAGAISDNVKSEFENLLPQASVERLTGQSRFETNGVIAENFAPKPSTVFLATGYGFADALAGSAVAAKNGDPILFVDPSVPTLPKAAARYLAALNKNNVRPSLVAFGGKGAVPEEILKTSRDLISGTEKETSIYSVEDITAAMFQNENYSLPKTVRGKLYNSETIDVPVKWSPAFVDTGSLGTYLYDGEVEGYDKKVKLNLTIKEPVMDLDEKVQYILSKIITPDMSDVRKELAVHDYLIKNAQYDYDPSPSWDSYTAYGVIVKGKGVCQGFAAATNLLLNRAGVESMIVVGTADGVDGWGGHAWNMVKIDGHYYHLDTTWDESYNEGYIWRTYFNMSDDEIAKDHKWDKKQYPACSKSFPTRMILAYKALGIEGEDLYYQDNKVLYKIRLDGTGEQTLMQPEDYILKMRWDEDWLYISYRCESYDASQVKYKISKLKRDGSQSTVVKEFTWKDAVNDFYVKDGFIYAILSDRIDKLNEEGSVVQTLAAAKEGEHLYSDFIKRFDGNWIYYYIFDSEKKETYYKVSLDGTYRIKISERTIE